MRLPHSAPLLLLALCSACAHVGSNPYLSATDRAQYRRTALPLEAGTRFWVSQGAYGSSTHNEKGNEYNWDFDVPFGTPVLSVDDGTVIQVWEPDKGGGCDLKFCAVAHNIKIKHRDGTVAQYVHIKSLVKTGQQVRKGFPIAITAMNGCICNPQLHFGIYRSESRLYDSPNRETIPLAFEGIPEGGLLKEGALYTVPAYPRMSSPGPAPMDSSMIGLCIGASAGDESAREALAHHPLASKMADGMKPQVVFTPSELATAATSSVDDKRFSWPVFKARQSVVRQLKAYLDENQESFVQSAVTAISRFLSADSGTTDFGKGDFRLNLVCGGAWDGYVLNFDSTSDVFFDLGLIVKGTLSETIPYLSRMVRHELWHVAFQKFRKAHWPVDYSKSEDSLDRLFYEMLNEGVGHYFSAGFDTRPDAPSIPAKSSAIFALLGKRFAIYRAEKSPEKREQLLWRSHAGVPFWEKWGAVPAAIMILRLQQALGPEGLRELLERDPFRFILKYDELARGQKQWDRLPPELVAAAKSRLRNGH